jgi:hypothetical protein
MGRSIASTRLDRFVSLYLLLDPNPLPHPFRLFYSPIHCTSIPLLYLNCMHLLVSVGAGMERCSVAWHLPETKIHEGWMGSL